MEKKSCAFLVTIFSWERDNKIPRARTMTDAEPGCLYLAWPNSQGNSTCLNAPRVGFKMTWGLSFSASFRMFSRCLAS